ncbi:MAG: glycosyltransferase family 4 protein [Phenylobacterium sp.]
MKILILSNFAYPHVGGCEQLIQLLAQYLQVNYACICKIMNVFTEVASCVYNGVVIEKMSMVENNFIASIKKFNPDIIFVYADNFIGLPFLLNNITKLPPLYIAPVGFNASRKKVSLLKQIISVSKYINFIPHSKQTIDFDICRQHGFKNNIIPNAIDTEEFNQERVEKSFSLLCVANFFPGKGHDYLIDIIKQSRYRKDIELNIFSSSKVPSSYNIMRFVDYSKKENINAKVHLDKHRTDVVNSYYSNSLFVFPSESEVFPLVILEAMAAGLPWVSFDVGNVIELRGGEVIGKKEKANNNLIPSIDDMHNMSKIIDDLLSDKEKRLTMGNDGKKQILEHYTLARIAGMYYQYFVSGFATI